MGTNSLHTELLRLANQAEPPPDGYKYHSFPQQLTLSAYSALGDAFNALVDEICLHSQSIRKSTHNDYRSHVEQFLLNISQSLVKNQWLLVSGRKEAFTGASKPFESYTHTKRITDYLSEEGLIHRKIGKRYELEPMRNRYYPVRELAQRLIQFSLYTETAIAPPYLKINDPLDNYKNFNWSADHPDLLPLLEINEFLRTQHWALKAPIRQVFKYDPFRSGRLHTPFQNLPTRQFNIRKQTLINGEPIIETDFNANHFRIFMALNKKDITADDPYGELADIANTSRATAKQFLTMALNCPDVHTARSAGTLEGITFEDSGALLDAVAKLYGDIDLFSEVGIVAM